jgi:hypothetical protein
MAAGVPQLLPVWCNRLLHASNIAQAQTLFVHSGSEDSVPPAGVSVQVMADQPLTASRRRQLLLNFVQAKLEAEDEQLVLEGARVRTLTACADNRLLC